MERNKKNRRASRRLVLMGSLLAAVCVVSVLGGAVKISIGDVFALGSGEPLTGAGRILLYVRLPRIAGALIAGIGLAGAGAVIQTILENPLAGPNIIGVNAGAGFAVTLCGALFPGLYAALPMAAFLGALLTVLFVYFLGKRTGSSKMTLVLSGVAVNSLFNGASDAVYTFREASLLSSNAFKIGGLGGLNIKVLGYAAIAVLAAMLLLLLFVNELEVFALGEETATALGLPVGFYRFFYANE